MPERKPVSEEVLTWVLAVIFVGIGIVAFPLAVALAAGAGIVAFIWWGLSGPTVRVRRRRRR